MGTCYHDGMLGPKVKLCVFQPICAISRIISKSGDGSNHTIQKNDGQILKLQRLGRYTTKITRRSLITGPSLPDFGAARLLIHWSQMTSQRFPGLSARSSSGSVESVGPGPIAQLLLEGWWSWPSPTGCTFLSNLCKCVWGVNHLQIATDKKNESSSRANFGMLRVRVSFIGETAMRHIS